MKDHQQLVGQSIKRIESAYDIKDTILFALGLGFGSDPMDKQELAFVYEQDLRTLPTMSLVIGYPGFWMREPEYGFQWQKVLHAEEELIIHEPLPVEGRLVGETFVDEVVDRGAEKGVFVYTRKELTDAVTGKQYATVVSNTLARGDGGFGGPSEPRPRQPSINRPWERASTSRRNRRKPSRPSIPQCCPPRGRNWTTRPPWSISQVRNRWQRRRRNRAAMEIA